MVIGVVALTWSQVMDWYQLPVAMALCWSAVAILAAVVVYFTLKKFIAVSPDNPTATVRMRLLVGTSVFFGLLFVLIRIWTKLLLGGDSDYALDLNKNLNKLLWTFVVALAVGVLSTASRHAFTRKVTALEDRHRVRLATTWVGVLAFLIISSFIWAGSIRDFGIFLGIVGAGLALSLQETLVSIAGWMLLLFRRPFDIGDRIEIDGRIGDVIDISVFQTSLLEVGNWVKSDQSTGRMLIIPNSMLFRHPVYNYSKGFPFIWDELSIIVTFESDWEQAENLMLEQAEIEAEKIETQVKLQIKRMQAHYAIRYQRLTPIVYTSIADNGVDLVLRYLCPVRERRSIRHRISRNVLTVFLKHPSIDLAYPTTRIYRNTEEGKSEIGGPPANPATPTTPAPPAPPASRGLA